MVQLLCGEGLPDIKGLYTDGTKTEANANWYSFVWGKSIKTNRGRIKKQLKVLWAYAKEVTATEINDGTDPSGSDKIDTQKVRQAIEAINTAVQEAGAVTAKPTPMPLLCA